MTQTGRKQMMMRNKLPELTVNQYWPPTSQAHAGTKSLALATEKVHHSHQAD